MTTGTITRSGFQEALETKAAELDRVLRTRDDIVIEKSADQMDEIQRAGYQTALAVLEHLSTGGRFPHVTRQAMPSGHLAGGAAKQPLPNG